MLAGTIELTETQFRAISDQVKALCGINLHDGKKELVKARLNKRLRTLGLAGFDDYLHYLRDDTSGLEITAMLDAISTNLTSFFREMQHFDVLRQLILPRLKASAARPKRLRVWSAGCSSGEEPYSIGILLHEEIPDLSSWDAKILATDLSTRVLQRAMKALYPASRVDAVAPGARQRYFTRTDYRGEKIYEVAKSVRDMVHFARLNLMESWPMKGPFDVIFCRNVMIYFDKPTQGTLVNRYYDMLAPGGMLFIGHSESLTGIRHRFKYVQPTVYGRP